MVEQGHQRFTVDTTAYLRNLSSEDRQGKVFAVHYQDPPEQTEAGTRISLRFPTLIVAYYVGAPKAIAEKVAHILNAHWDDPE